MSTNVVD
jgi:hypothetical protein